MAYKLHLIISNTETKQLLSDEEMDSPNLISLIHFCHSILELLIEETEALPVQSNGSTGDRRTETTDGDNAQT